MSIATEIQRLQTAKNALKTAISAKGVEVPSSATLDTYYSYVQQISQGPTLQWVTFNSNDDISGLNVYGIKGLADDLANNSFGGDITFTANRTTVDCLISSCYSHTYDYNDNVELVFADIGCSDYYTLGTATAASTLQLLIYN